MGDDEGVLLALILPSVVHPCKCGHSVFDHGDDNRDTSCTECNCPKFKDACTQ